MNNFTIRSYRMEELRKGIDFFEYAKKQLSEGGKLHDSFYSAFPETFESMQHKFQDKLSLGKFLIPKVEEEYLLNLISDHQDFLAEFTDIITGKFISEVKSEVDQLRNKLATNEIFVEYLYPGDPANLYSDQRFWRYRVELNDYMSKLKVLSGEIVTLDKADPIGLKLDSEIWFPIAD